MVEKFTPSLDEIEGEAERLRQRHVAHSESLERARDLNAQAQELRDRIAASDNPDEEFTYHDQAFANGEITQKAALKDAKLHYSANMWDAQEHSREHRDAYVEIAEREAEAEESPDSPN